MSIFHIPHLTISGFDVEEVQSALPDLITLADTITLIALDNLPCLSLPYSFPFSPNDITPTGICAFILNNAIAHHKNHRIITPQEHRACQLACHLLSTAENLTPQTTIPFPSATTSNIEALSTTHPLATQANTSLYPSSSSTLSFYQRGDSLSSSAREDLRANASTIVSSLGNEPSFPNIFVIQIVPVDLAYGFFIKKHNDNNSLPSLLELAHLITQIALNNLPCLKAPLSFPLHPENNTVVGICAFILNNAIAQCKQHRNITPEERQACQQACDIFTKIIQSPPSLATPFLSTSSYTPALPSTSLRILPPPSIHSVQKAPSSYPSSSFMISSSFSSEPTTNSQIISSLPPQPFYQKAIASLSQRAVAIPESSTSQKIARKRATTSSIPTPAVKRARTGKPQHKILETCSNEENFKSIVAPSPSTTPTVAIEITSSDNEENDTENQGAAAKDIVTPVPIVPKAISITDISIAPEEIINKTSQELTNLLLWPPLAVPKGHYYSLKIDYFKIAGLWNVRKKRLGGSTYHSRSFTAKISVLRHKAQNRRFSIILNNLQECLNNLPTSLAEIENHKLNILPSTTTGKALTSENNTLFSLLLIIKMLHANGVVQHLSHSTHLETRILFEQKLKELENRCRAILGMSPL